MNLRQNLCFCLLYLFLWLWLLWSYWLWILPNLSKSLLSIAPKRNYDDLITWTLWDKWDFDYDIYTKQLFCREMTKKIHLTICKSLYNFPVDAKELESATTRLQHNNQQCTSQKNWLQANINDGWLRGVRYRTGAEFFEFLFSLLSLGLLHHHNNTIVQFPWFFSTFFLNHVYGFKN